MEKRIIIIDGNSLINRTYYAMQKPMITKEGLYTQGVYGFINMLTKIKKDYPAGYIAVAFDVKAPTFRHKEYDQYKAGRKPMAPELAMQLPLLKDVLDAMNITMIEREGFEADDIIGSLSLKAEEAGLEPLIITGDRDELQLASDITKVLITKKGISSFELYDREAMVEKYGFGPDEFIDYKGLMGDQSDNIPGIPGVGEKTASKLILEFGSVENLLANTDKISAKGLRKKVEENGNLAVMSKRLATINRHMDLDMSPLDMKWTDADRDKLIEIYKRLEFNSFLRRMGSEGSTDAGSGTGKDEMKPGVAVSTADANSTFKSEKSTAATGTASSGADAAPRTRRSELTGGADLRGAAGEINGFEPWQAFRPENVKRAGILSADDVKSIAPGTEVTIKIIGDGNHRAKPVIMGAALLWDDSCGYIDLSSEEVTGELIEVAETWRLSGHDLKNDIYMLMCHGLKEVNVDFDTAVAQYVLDSSRSNYGMSAMAEEYFHLSVKSEKDLMEENGQADMMGESVKVFEDYGFTYCTVSRGIRDIQEQELKDKNLDFVCRGLEFPLVKVMAYMEMAGFCTDRDELQKTGAKIKGEIDDLTAQIHELAGEEFNINSTQQLGTILFEKLGLPAGKKTKRGYSTSAEVLEKLKDTHPIIDMVLRYRTLTKLNGTYIDGLIPLVGQDRRIHAHFNQTVTATGRISGSDPNLQNIPIRYEQGREIRKAFVAPKGFVLIGADYSQIELRVLAHMSEDPALIDSFNNGEDIHKATAAKVLGVPADEITPAQRSRAKAVNFGVIYGMSAFGLSTELHITRKEADQYINDYFEKHPKVREFMDEQIRLCKERGYVETIMGRRRYINEILASNRMVRQLGERLAMNSPIQGSAADIIKIAMAKVYDSLKEYRSKLILQVHDELLIEAAEDEVEQVEKLLRENMENAVELKVKTTVDINRGQSWYDLK